MSDAKRAADELRAIIPYWPTHADLVERAASELEKAERIYLSAVKGRQDFRRAYRQEQDTVKRLAKRVDQYGIILKMIAEGCGDPRQAARDALAKYAVLRETETKS